jgi:hypothetical protein
MAAIVLVGGAIAIAFGERIGINGGQGWDGISYTQWASDFWTHVVHDGLARYHAQRVLPSALIDLALHGQPHTVPNILRAFAIANVVWLAAAAVLWAHLAHAMKWSRLAAWAGFVAMFVTFANAKHATYYPALTDTPAFALGMWMVWAYLLDKPIALWLCALVGVVTWPALPPLAVAMLIFPRAVLSAGGNRRISIALAAVGALAFVVVGFHFLAHPVPGVGDEKFAAWVPRDLLWVTVPVLVAMLGVGFYLTLAPVGGLLEYVRALARRRLAIAVLAVAVLYAGRAWYLARVGTRGEGPTGAQFLCEHTLSALRGPVWGLVHHVVYFGPVIAVALVMWKRIAAIAASWGPAAVLASGMTVAFAAGSNSRQWSHLVPFLVAATIAATDSLWTRERLIGFTVLAVIWSKVWFHLGYDTVLDWHTFPNQRYFMNTGPYAATLPYLVHLAAAVVTVALVLVTVRSRRRA